MSAGRSSHHGSDEGLALLAGLLGVDGLVNAGFGADQRGGGEWAGEGLGWVGWLCGRAGEEHGRGDQVG
jgi:hypothetical protein